jgi:hypothetical protein
MDTAVVVSERMVWWRQHMQRAPELRARALHRFLSPQLLLSSPPIFHPPERAVVTCWLQLCGVHGFVTMALPPKGSLLVYDIVERFLQVDHPELGLPRPSYVMAFFVGRKDEAPDMRAEPTVAQRVDCMLWLLGTRGLTGEPCLKLVPRTEVHGKRIGEL